MTRQDVGLEHVLVKELSMGSALTMLAVPFHSFFFCFFFGRDGYSLHKCNDSNLKTM